MNEASPNHALERTTLAGHSRCSHHLRPQPPFRSGCARPPQLLSLGAFGHRWKPFFLILMGLLSFLTGCSRPKLVEGGLYYTRSENGGYSVLKILKRDDHGVHVRLYSNHFDEPPTKIDERTLYLAGVDHKPGETLGMGHAPISKKSFESWKATFVQQSAVKEEELEGYNEWKKASGGYF